MDYFDLIMKILSLAVVVIGIPFLVIYGIYRFIMYIIHKKTEYEYRYKEYYDIKREVEEIEKDLYSKRDWEE